MPASSTRRAPRRRTGSGDSDRIDKVAALHDTLTEAVADLMSGEQWRAMLATAARFHRYSLSNLLLIYRKRPDATRVAGFTTWKRLGRNVRKGERGIPILAPCTYKRDAPDDDGRDQRGVGPEDGSPRRVLRGFRVVYVFDIAQTDGEPVPDVAPVLLDSEDPGRLYDALAAQVAAAGYTLHRAGCGAANGVTNFEERTVTVRSDCSPAQACETLAHELAHVLMHGPADTTGDRRRERIEVEAESVAYVVCHAAGLDTADYSLPYVAGWAGGDLAVVKDSAERVVTTARAVLDRLAADTGCLADVTAVRPGDTA